MERNKYYQSKSFLKLLHRYEEAVSEGHVPYLEADELTDIAEYYMTGRQDAKANQAIQAAIDMHPEVVLRKVGRSPLHPRGHHGAR